MVDWPIVLTYTDCIRLAVLQLLHESNGKPEPNLNEELLQDGMLLQELLPYQFCTESNVDVIAREVKIG